MMINSNYAQQVALAKSNNATLVNFSNTTAPVQAIAGEQDTVTLSDKALAMMNGTEIKEIAPTYVKPETAKSLLVKSEGAKNDVLHTSKSTSRKADVIFDNRFNEIMQNILDQRLGIDRDKLKEIEAMMEEIANNENMSPEEKQQALEKLAEMREKVIEESREVREFSKQTE